MKEKRPSKYNYKPHYVIAKKPRNINPTTAYDSLFPPAINVYYTVQRNANVGNTVDFIPKVVAATLDHTKRIAEMLSGRDTSETCRNIWKFVYRHINYKKDEDGYEQVRSPRRAWHDRFTGVDCDCYTVFISSILSNLRIPHTLRITKYSHDYFQHIYPVVSLPNGRQVIIDCVTDQFDYEVPFTEKKDYPMELQYLNGPDETLYGEENNVVNGNGSDELGRLLWRHMQGGRKKALKFHFRHKGKHHRQQPPPEDAVQVDLGPNASQPGGFPDTSSAAPAYTPPAALPPPTDNLITPAPAPADAPAAETPQDAAPPQADGDASQSDQPMGSFISKALHAVNRLNPAMMILRTSLLGALKLNILNVAKNLRWSYLTAQQATQQRIIPDKFKKLLKIRQKLESIFKGAGGNPNNLKKAILNGKGNKDKAVHGFDGLGEIDFGVIDAMDGMDENTPLVQLLGPEIYYDENSRTFNGFNTAGEPLGAVTIAAAMAAVTTLAKLISSVGSIFGKGKDQGQDAAITDDASAASASTDAGNDAAPSAAIPSAQPVVTPSSPTVAVKQATAASFQPAPVNDGSADDGSTLPAATASTSPEVKTATVAPLLPAPVNDGSADDGSTLPTATASTSPGVKTATVAPLLPAPVNDGSTLPATTTPPAPKQGFWDKNKKWVIGAAIGVSLLTVVAILARKKHAPVSGIPRKRKKKYSKQLNGTIEEIELL